MSEPESKLDMTALNDALDGESNAGGTKDVPTQSKPSEEAARETMNKSNTLTVDANAKIGKGSPETLSPGSPSEEQLGNVRSTQSPAAGTPAIPSNNTQITPLDPTTQQIKTMFPDIDTDTIQAVVVAEGGDFERAINTLLQMSDPTYVPPPPRELSQTEQDEQFARSLAASEEQNARSQRQFVNPSSARGGALGSLFGIGAQGQEQSQSPSYDPSNLSYQPRVRRTASGNQSTNAPRPAYSPQNSTGFNGQVGAGLPGPKDAKQWQDDINKFAEQGFAKAASTFSALRQKGEQAWAQRNQASPGEGAYNSQAPPTGRGGSFFGGWNQRNPSGSSGSTASPTIGSGRGFDRDPSPVGENELAKILARGRNDSASGDSSPARKNSLGNIADRYKKVAGGQRQGGSKSSSMSKNDGLDDDADDANFGWDDAGRTGDKTGGKSFEPIKISDNSVDTPPTSAKSQSQRTAVSLMEGSAGRGITSPRLGSHAESDKNATHQDAHNNDDDDDDLEYVANPFEDED
ncbi:hypothetical protein L7F22_038879 [Adiantum nelumboides]|nr:hypothetical protein [Adiantum nelumboides]